MITAAILRRSEVMLMCGVGSASTLRRMIMDGYFPPPVRLGKRSVGWRASDVVSWLEGLRPHEEKTRSQG